MYTWANSEYIRFCSTATAVENHMKAEFFWEWQFQTSVHSPQQPHLFNGAAPGSAYEKWGFKKGQTRLVHSVVNSRYIQVHSGQFGEHSILQHSGRC